MLTRLEVNGFKNLVDFALDFGPFTCIFGPNGVGKSNIFDAIGFLSLLTELPINEAALAVRGGDGFPGITGLLRTGGTGRQRRMSFAVEMLVEPNVADDFGRRAESSSSFLRYEIAFRYEPPMPDSSRPGGLALEREELRPITAGRASRHLKFPHSKARFRDALVYNRRHARTGFISTIGDAETDQNRVVVHQDGGVPGWGQPALAELAARTIIGTENTAATPTILAARREMQGWLVLALDPNAIQKPDPYSQPPGIADNGAHIPATLRSLSGAADTEALTPDDAVAAVSQRLSGVSPVRGLRLMEDDTQRLLSLEVEEADGLTLPAGSLSDSALRSLALATLAILPDQGRMLCIDAPENGFYPTSLGTVNDLLHEIAVNPEEAPGTENPLRQVVVISQSPWLVKRQSAPDLVWADNQRADLATDAGIRALRCVPHRGTWRCAGGIEGFDLDDKEPFGSPQQVAQIAFPPEIWATGPA